MKAPSIFIETYKLLMEATEESLAGSLDNCHAPGLFSLSINCTEKRKTRIFMAKRSINPFDVAFHTHRYPLTIAVICGRLTHHTASTVQSFKTAARISQWSYVSPLSDMESDFLGLKYEKEVEVFFDDYHMPPGSRISLEPDDFHTVSCPAGTMWIRQEGKSADSPSKVLGVPFNTNGLYTLPNLNEINKNKDLAASELKKLISEYVIADL